MLVRPGVAEDLLLLCQAPPPGVRVLVQLSPLAQVSRCVERSGKWNALGLDYF